MPSSDQQHQILTLHNRMLMSPEEFSYKWNVSYETLAELCCLSKTTTYHWLGGQASRCQSGQPYRRILAVSDFLIVYADQIYPLLEEWNRQEMIFAEAVTYQKTY